MNTATKSTSKESSLKMTDTRSAAEYWDSVAENYQKTLSGGETDYTGKLLAFLTENKALPAGRILDLGCGAGKYSIKFVQMNSFVTAADISAKMLDYTRSNLAALHKADMWEIRQCDWNTCDLNAENMRHSYDLVFAAMTPAVTTVADMQKMCAAAKGWCFMSRFSQFRNLLTEKLHTLAEIERTDDYRSKPDTTGELVAALREYGCEPIITYTDYNWENTLSPKEAAETVLRNETDLPDAQKQRIREAAYSLRAENGAVIERVETKAVWLLWNVNRK